MQWTILHKTELHKRCITQICSSKITFFVYLGVLKAKFLLNNLSDFTHWRSLMREREAAGNDLMDIIGDVGSLNQILYP